MTRRGRRRTRAGNHGAPFCVQRDGRRSVAVRARSDERPGARLRASTNEFEPARSRPPAGGARVRGRRRRRCDAARPGHPRARSPIATSVGPYGRRRHAGAGRDAQPGDTHTFGRRAAFWAPPSEPMTASPACWRGSLSFRLAHTLLPTATSSTRSAGGATAARKSCLMSWPPPAPRRHLSRAAGWRCARAPEPRLPPALPALRLWTAAPAGAALPERQQAAWLRGSRARGDPSARVRAASTRCHHSQNLPAAVSRAQRRVR